MSSVIPCVNRAAVVTSGDTNGHRLIQDIMPLKIITKKEGLFEDVHGTKRHTLRLGGQVQYADRPNANGRIYERDILGEAVRALQPDIQARRVLGELDHPADAKIHMDRVSHLMTKLWMEDDGGVYGELEILRGTIMGDQLAALVENGVTVGISSRGVGDLDDVVFEGQMFQRVLPGYTLVTFDVVGEPSVDGSFLSVMESRQRNAQMNVKRQKEAAILEEFKRHLRQR